MMKSTFGMKRMELSSVDICKIIREAHKCGVKEIEISENDVTVRFADISVKMENSNKPEYASKQLVLPENNLDISDLNDVLHEADKQDLLAIQDPYEWEQQEIANSDAEQID